MGKGIVAVITGDVREGVLECEVGNPTATDNGAAIVDRIVSVLTEHDGCIRGRGTLRKAVGCRNDALTDPLQQLTDAGILAIEQDGTTLVFRIANDDSPF